MRRINKTRALNFQEKDKKVAKYERKTRRLRAKRAYEDEKHGRPKRKSAIGKALDVAKTAAIGYGVYKGGKKLYKKGTKMYKNAIKGTTQSTTQSAVRGATSGAIQGTAQGIGDAAKAGWKNVTKVFKKNK